MEHEWIVQFSQEIAREMSNHEGRIGQFPEQDDYLQEEEMPTEVLQDIIEIPSEEAAYPDEQEEYQEEIGQA